MGPGEDRLLLRVRLVELHVGGLDHEVAAFRHRVSGVDCQVHDHLLELTGIGLDTIERPVQRGHQPDVLADQALQERLGARHDTVEIEHLRLQDLLTAEGQQLLGQRCGAFAGPPHLLDVGACGMPGLEFVEHEVAVAEDDGEQVVEVVGDAAGEASDGFHLARLLELILQSAARVFHLHPCLEIVDQPLLGTLNLARHDVESTRQPANLIAMLLPTLRV